MSERRQHGLAPWCRCGRSSMAEHQLPKLTVRVRFPSPAPLYAQVTGLDDLMALVTIRRASSLPLVHPCPPERTTSHERIQGHRLSSPAACGADSVSGCCGPRHRPHPCLRGGQVRELAHQRHSGGPVHPDSRRRGPVHARGRRCHGQPLVGHRVNRPVGRAQHRCGHHPGAMSIMPVSSTPPGTPSFGSTRTSSGVESICHDGSTCPAAPSGSRSAAAATSGGTGTGAPASSHASAVTASVFACRRTDCTSSHPPG